MGLAIRKKPNRQTFATYAEEHRIAWWGSENPKVLFVVDPIVSAAQPRKTPVTKPQLEFLAPFIRNAGLSKDDILIVTACHPVTPEEWESDRSMGKIVGDFGDKFHGMLDLVRPKLIVSMGKTAARSAFGHAVKITNIRGMPVTKDDGTIIHPIFGVSHVINQPDILDTFTADFDTIGRIVSDGFVVKAAGKAVEKSYEWCTDLSDLIALSPKVCSIDAEWVGGEWYDPDLRLLTLQFCWEEGKAVSVPIDYDHKEGGIRLDGKYKKRITEQLRQFILSGKTKFFGHNIKADWHVIKSCLDITLPKFGDDTILMTHAVDENMLNKSLDDCVRRWVPALSGYADEFNRDPIHVQKSRMDLVPPDKMLEYGCGDVDATFRLRKVLRALLKKDEKSYECYRRVTLPASRALCDIERNGMPVSIDALRAFDEELSAHQAKEYERLLAMIPKVIVEKHDDAKKKKQKTPLVIRQALLRDYLFTHPKGLRIKPLVFTKSTRNKKDPKERVPSISSKDHFPYFADKYPFVAGIIQFIKNEKLLGTYVGEEEEDSGFWKYIRNGSIYPFYILHRTVTGRSNSVKPNGQNLPKRGKFAKKYRSVFVAPPGKVFIQADYSQLELRLVAIAANEPTMLKIFRTGGDIHAATAAAINGVSLDKFMTWPEEKRELARFRAKAVNFGFCIAKGSRVLTDRGEIPIEEVTVADLLWDGIEWVNHKGVVCRGEQEVITHDGLTATPDHKVYVEGQRRPIPFRHAASKIRSRQLIVGADKGMPARVEGLDRENRGTTSKRKNKTVLRTGVLRVRTTTVGTAGQHLVRQEYKLRMSARSKVSYKLPREDAWEEIRLNGAKVHKVVPSILRKLQGTGDTSSVQVETAFYRLGLNELGADGLQGDGLRQNRQRRALLSREFAPRNAVGESTEHATKQETVYDIIDAGPRRRFVVNGKLVSNCYGMGWRKFKSYAKTDYGVDLTDEEAMAYRSAYFKQYPGIARWHEAIRLFVRKHTYVRAFDGRTRHLKAIRSPEESVQQQAERYAINSPIQGFGSDLGLMALTRINDEVERKTLKMHGFVHDALVAIAPEKHVLKAARTMKRYMESNPTKEWFNWQSPIPIIADIEIGKTLADLKKCGVSVLQDEALLSYDDFVKKTQQPK